MALGFDCPACGDTNVFEDDVEPEDIKDRVYSCEGCGENILLDNYRGEKA